MKFSLSCDTFARLANVVMRQDDDPKTYAPQYSCVRMEYYTDSVMLAVATNRKVVAVERCTGNGFTPGTAINIIAAPELVAQCRDHPNEVLTIAADNAQTWGVVSLSHGWTYLGNGCVKGEWPDWRKLVPKELPSKVKTPMGFHAVHIAKLGASSPSGYFILPRVVDGGEPLIVRDPVDPNWFGIFHPRVTPTAGEPVVEFAKLPEWL